MELAVSKHRWSLRLLGIWPDRDSLSELRFLITLGLIVSVIIPQLVDLCRNDRETVIENLSSLIPCILVTIKLLIIRLNMRRLSECLNAIAQDWDQEWEPDLREEFTGVMTRNAKIGRSFNIACTVLLYVTALGLLNNFPHSKSKVKSILESSYLCTSGPQPTANCFQGSSASRSPFRILRTVSNLFIQSGICRVWALPHSDFRSAQFTSSILCDQTR